MTLNFRLIATFTLALSMTFTLVGCRGDSCDTNSDCATGEICGPALLCVDATSDEDAGTTEQDAGATEQDAGSTAQDAGSTAQDAGSTDEDAGTVVTPGCDGECDDGEFTACTCAAADPCDWVEDTWCDGACRAMYPDDYFDDSVDCHGGDCTDESNVSTACSADAYNTCTCAADDPCAWEGDGFCDFGCEGVAPGYAFNDDFDCDEIEETDAGTPTDGGSDVDAGDGCVEELDAGVPGTIADVRAAIDDDCVNILVDGVLATQIDDSGFYVQDSQTGPGIYVYIHTSTKPAVGNEVSFQVTDVIDYQGLREVNNVGNTLVITPSTNDTSALVQDLTDTATTLGEDLESELVKVTGATVTDIANGIVTIEQNSRTMLLLDAPAAQLCINAVVSVQGVVREKTPEFESATYYIAVGSAYDINDTACVQVTPADPGLKINEVDYDNVDTDVSEFVEIYNSSDAAVDLTDLSLLILNDSGLNAVPAVALAPAVSIPASGYMVIATQSLIDATAAIGDGTSVPAIAFPQPKDNLGNSKTRALVIFDTVAKTVVDSMFYKYTVDTIAIAVSGTVDPLPIGSSETAGVDSNSVERSLARCPDGRDTDLNSRDFLQLGTVTPGTANDCGP